VNNLRGFTLVEVMISVLILGVGLTSVANSYLLALRGANSVQSNVSALILAKEQFENLEVASLKGVKPFSFPPEIIKSAAKDYNCQQEIMKLPEFKDIESVITEPISPEPVSVESDCLAKYLVLACQTIS
jgi:prepilin-type N-terminal cleavage/methylation domain-containing protein